MRSIADLFLESLSLRFLLNFSSHNRSSSGRSYIVMMCLIILQGKGKVAMVSSAYSTTVWYCISLVFPWLSCLPLFLLSYPPPLPKNSEVFFCMRALQPMSYCSYFTEMLNWFRGFCFVELWTVLHSKHISGEKSVAIKLWIFLSNGVSTQYCNYFLASREFYPKTSECQQTFV